MPGAMFSNHPGMTTTLAFNSPKGSAVMARECGVMKLRYVQINAHARDWSNSIIFTRHRELLEIGNDSWVFWARGGHAQDANMVKIAIFPEVCLDALMTRLDGRPGFYSKGITRRLLKKLDSIDPDVVHLHVLHGYYINIEMLFNWLLNHDCRVVWTLHDCWPFTGHCMHFLNAECDQWETGCGLLYHQRRLADPQPLCGTTLPTPFQPSRHPMGRPDIWRLCVAGDIVEMDSFRELRALDNVYA